MKPTQTAGMIMKIIQSLETNSKGHSVSVPDRKSTTFYNTGKPSVTEMEMDITKIRAFMQHIRNWRNFSPK